MRKLSPSKKRAIAILITGKGARCYELLSYETKEREEIGITDGNDNDYTISPFTLKWLITFSLVEKKEHCPSMWVNAFFPTERLMSVASEEEIKPFK